MTTIKKHKSVESGRYESPARRGGSGVTFDAPVAGGASLTVAFVTSMGVAVLVAALIAGGVSYMLATGAAREAIDFAGTSAANNKAAEQSVVWTAKGQAYSLRDVTVQPAEIKRRGEVLSGSVYRAYIRNSGVADTPVDIIVDAGLAEFQRSLVLTLTMSSVIVVGVGIGVAYLLSRRVVGPVTGLMEDVRKISHGELDHPIRVNVGGEVGMLAKSVDRMIRSLRDAQDAKEAAKVHEHELAIAAEVRDSLIPRRTPELPGYEIAADLAEADSVGGDVYDYIEGVGGSLQLSVFVAGISARGVPGAMLMTMARAYLHQSFAAEPSPSAALKAANRPITRDMRPGLFVTTLAATLDPATGIVKVACAGHKAPLFHYVASTQSINWVHPEGIALGFDPGPVFDRAAREQEIQLNPGDRVVLTTAGSFAATNAEGVEFGEERFAELIKKHAAKTSGALCQLIGKEIQQFRGDEPLVEDVVIVTIRRKNKPGGAA
ncbi:MAG: SpoIIE family protein phosphatase [Planctomycetes bacterium]|nr:SpoIIE family protein phosphatase [Planctomycetota bacterium]